MRNRALRGALGLAAAALVHAQPAAAAMSCWNEHETAAAKIRDLQSRLMVATLRCRAMGIDVLTAYNDFVRINRSTLQEANGVIKAQFDRGYGRDGQRFYDSFTTAMANQYGADETSGQVCEDTAAIASEAVAADGDVARLVELADRTGGSPDLPGGICPVTLTAR
ncbi:MAG TPA: hypothetical protein VD846_10890 [Allosphingosinicella sp.]|nr:hypothetical protein [Allosphingosinicella sp.]